MAVSSRVLITPRSVAKTTTRSLSEDFGGLACVASPDAIPVAPAHFAGFSEVGSREIGNAPA
jgi:hypothetical protein